jgi:hypothetical protein
MIGYLRMKSQFVESWGGRGVIWLRQMDFTLAKAQRRRMIGWALIRWYGYEEVWAQI